MGTEYIKKKGYNFFKKIITNIYIFKKKKKKMIYLTLLNQPLNQARNH
jgi:hypothetical protein